MSKTVFRMCFGAYFSFYDIKHWCFITSSIIHGFSGFAGGEGTYPPQIAGGYCTSYLMFVICHTLRRIALNECHD